MARGRMINKVISLDEKVNALSNDSVRLLFTWLIPHLDCEGRMYGDPQTVKSIVFPQRSMDVRTTQKYLDELAESGLIQRYANGGTTYICFPNFKKHQIGLNKSKELPSQIPAPETGNLRKDSGNNPAQVKVETKVKVKVEEKDTPLNPPVSQSLSTKEVITAYQENILLGGTVNEEMEYELSAACARYSQSWVMDAIREALAQNQPFWRYIVGILKNWQRDGKPSNLIKAKSE
ncbi:MAG: hypothetical protein MUP17_00240 [candidate division Zixibacteria bacterium]|nr:hypothetical protein [candidate division Zixibacteria bacterium]